MTSPRIRCICVFLGSSAGRVPAYVAAARHLGESLARRGISLVFGGSHLGTMGVLSDAVLAGGGKVTGVIPGAMVHHGVEHQDLTELHVVGSMHERKRIMAETADAFIALPGGIGTMEELFEAITWNLLGIHRKPIGLLNLDGYFDALLEFSKKMVDEEFLARDFDVLLVVEKEIESLLERLQEMKVPKAPIEWLDLDEI